MTGRQILSGGGFQAEADCDCDGETLTSWISNHSSTSWPVYKPAGDYFNGSLFGRRCLVSRDPAAEPMRRYWRIFHASLKAAE